MTAAHEPLTKGFPRPRPAYGQVHGQPIAAAALRLATRVRCSRSFLPKPALFRWTVGAILAL